MNPPAVCGFLLLGLVKMLSDITSAVTLSKLKKCCFVFGSNKPFYLLVPER